MKTQVAVLVLALFCSSYAFAEKPIAKCVNAQGELTFTDYLCVTEESGNNPLLMTEIVVEPTVRAKIPSVVRAEAITSNKLKSATTEAQNQCQQQFGKYFKRKHPSVTSIPEVEFSRVVDQFVKGSNVSISLSANVEYEDDSYAINSSIECTVQRFKPASDWMVGYRER